MPISIAGSGAVTGASTLNGLTVPTDAIAPALVLINKTDFNAVSTVSVNNCFSATYSNYKIVISDLIASTAVNSLIRLRSNGTDTTTSYAYRRAYLGATAWGAWQNGTDALLMIFAVTAVSGGAGIHEICIGSPFANQYTNAFGIGSLGDGYIATGRFDGTTSFDGFSIIGNGGTLTGTVRVYGMRNA